jgi:hypothetical protein
MEYTFPPLIFGALQLARRVTVALGPNGKKTPIKKLYQFVHELCSALATAHTELALRLFVQAALAADASGFGVEFFSQGETFACVAFSCNPPEPFTDRCHICFLFSHAPGVAAFILYEDIVESKLQMRCLSQIVSAMLSARGMDVDNYGS